ncbi:SuUR family protein [Megaselia abdita]
MLRNIIRDYCGSYRLRRYVHQYEQFMPLTNKMDFEKHFQNWLGIGNNSNSMLSSNGNISSQDSVKIISSNSSTNTNELFETLFLAPKSQEIFQNAQSMGFLDHEEDVMPPLMFEDESDTEQSEKQPTSSEKPIKKEQSKKVETKNKKIETKNKKVETKNNKTAEKHTKTLEKNTKTVDKDEIKRRKLAKMLEIDFTSKYQVNKSILKEVEREMVSRERKVSSDKEKPVIVKKEVKRLSPVKMLLPIREPKLKEKPVNKQLEKLKKLLDIDCTPKHQFNKNVLDDVVKQEEEDEENRKKVSKKKVDQKKQRTEKEKEKDKKKPKEIEKKERKSPSLDELKRKKLERLLQIDFTPKYQLNNLSRKLAKAAKSRDLKKVIPKERKRAKDREQNTPSQNAQKFVESASPDTTTQDFISPRTSIVNSNELLHLDIDGELEKLKDSLNEVVVEEEPETDVIDLIDDSDEDDDDFVKSPDIFGGRMDELITDDESINCSQTLPTPRTQIPSTIKPAKPKKSQSCLQQLESQDLSTDGNNFMDVYSDFLQAQKSNESSPYKTTQNNKPTATGNKITKYFGGASSAMQAREILKTPTRRKSFSGVRRSPKTPPNIQNNNIMTWLVRPSSSSSADHQDSSITSSIKDVKRRRLDY